MNGIPVVVRTRHGEKALMLLPSSWDDAASQFHEALAERVGLPADAFDLTVERTGSEISRTDIADGAGVLAGDVLIVGPRTRTSPASASIEAVAGPHCGSRWVLTEGPNQIGRSDSSSVALINDEAVSRAHAVISIERGVATLVDTGSSNGTQVDGSPVTAVINLREGSVLEVGDSTLVLHLPHGSLGTHLSPASGRLLFNRPPRFIEPDPAVTFPVKPPPSTPSKRKVPIAAALVPLMLGVVMAVVLRQPLFLLFTLMSPIMVIGSFIEDRRTGRTEFRSDSAEWIEQLNGIAEDLAFAQFRETQWRREKWPGADHVLAAIAASSSELWQRRLADDDFADVRVGIADLPSGVALELAEGGAEDLRAQATRVAESASMDVDVPVVVALRELGVLGIVGAERARAETLNWLLVQLAAHHSPRDLDLVVLAPHDRPDVEWVSWLPHAFSPGAVEPSIATDPDHSKKLFASVQTLIEARRAESQQMVGSRRWSPLTVVVVVAPLDVSAREVSELLRDAAEQGLAVIWSCRSSGELPNECTAVLSLVANSASLTFTGDGYPVPDLKPERLDSSTTQRAARSLAPLVDVTAGSRDNNIPDSVPLSDIIGRDALTATGIIDMWSNRPPGLSAPVGMSSTGPFSLDFLADGPHGLLVGMTGAGKSGVLQAIVGSIAATHPPTAVNFMFIDFKGGAGFGPLIELPHSVGLVTDLDSRMARRALVSLEAELHRREVITAEAGVDGIRDLNKIKPGAMPHLVILVDEFAKLKSAIPEFIDGLVDVAQRGRSLGVHLMLAAQEAGKIDESFKLNSNLKIALRVATPSASSDVIERPDAAHLPEKVPGRGIVKTGHRIETVQFGYAGGATHLQGLVGSTAPESRTITLGRYTAPAQVDIDPTDTDLHQLVFACRDAARQSGASEVHRPWIDPLPDVVDLNSLRPSRNSAPTVVVGLLDDPARQRQVPWTIDLDQIGSVVVYGSSGAGLTTFLRTISISLADRTSPAETNLYAFDFASRGLGMLKHLPHCGDVVAADNIDRVRRLIAMLADTAEQRRKLLADSGGGSVAELQQRGLTHLPKIVVLIDGYASFWSTLEPIDRSEHLDTIQRLIAEGRSLGLHFIITADRRGSVPPAVSSAVGLHLAMRLANSDEYSSLGRPDLSKATSISNGRIFFPDGLEAQVAVAGDDPSSEGQAISFERAGLDLAERWPGMEVSRVRLLPEVVTLSELNTSISLSALAIGVGEASAEAVVIDLATNPYFFVVGPDGSGRTTALASLATSYGSLKSLPDSTVWWATTRGAAAVPVGPWDTRATRADDVTKMVTDLVAEISELEAAGGRADRLLVIDDADELIDPSFQAPLDQLVRRGRDVGITIAVSMSTYRASAAFNQWVKSLRSHRHGLLLQPDLDTDGDIFSLRLPRRAGLALPPGRACLVTRRGTQLIQVALSTSDPNR